MSSIASFNNITSNALVFSFANSSETIHAYQGIDLDLLEKLSVSQFQEAILQLQRTTILFS